MRLLIVEDSAVAVEETVAVAAVETVAAVEAVATVARAPVRRSGLR